jgi:large subunit ribosomal protein L24
MPSVAKKQAPPVKIQLRKNDQVKVIAGRDKGKTGRILDVNERKNPAKQIAGGIAEREAPIAVSNVMILCGKCGAVRIKHHVDHTPGGKTRRQRICHKCGQSLDK